MSRSLIMSLVIYATIACVAAAGVNFFLGATVESVRTAQMGTASVGDIDRLTAENKRLQAKVDSLRTQTDRNSARKMPSLGDLKQVVAAHNLVIRRMERLTVSGKEKGNTAIHYNIWISGALTNSVEFLHDLSQNFVLNYDQVTLQRGNEDGSIIATGISLAVTEE
jgi:hypothetical protein